ncbi:DNA adenine methylase [Paenibacillus naphthalenovorans]|uniref:Site-specific DNA-methyltransferase (adenine-specific) n=1 Tax=Paenibacillus naphthalenovorans TaxID=162209 RepID=A0A0U2IM76_9BACL|nr:DNA adenine methylase [Paenibacillus naphthalenovorans]ALS22171.1 modification methylase FokI [Paenibacillus naphthalenovorans]
MNKKYIKSPMNYIGGKYKLLPQLLPLFPENIGTFVDLFAGGCNVGINIEAKKVICNDKEQAIINLYNECKKHSSEVMLEILDKTIKKYELSKTNQEGYLKLRNDYNSGNRSWYMFYALLTHSFNNQFRFNSKGEFNMSFGKNRSSFNPTLRRHFIAFVNILKQKNIVFTNKDYKKLTIGKLKEGDFVYCDPPYLITTATYNEQGGWTEKDEKELLYMLDYLDIHKVKFALSNVLIHKGKENKILQEWSNKYKVHKMDYNYANCNYQSKIKNKDSTIEVLITNY